MAADNDIAVETINGNNTTQTTLAIYQQKQHSPMPARVVHADHSRKRTSVNSTRELLVIEDVNIGGRRPNLADFVGSMSSPGLRTTASFFPPVWKLSAGCSFTFQTLSFCTPNKNQMNRPPQDCVYLTA